MSVEVRGITKQYGTQKAVDDLSFEVSKGEILGFLGPNGAGKSTSMKIITGYLMPDSGSTLVNGAVTSEDPLAVKRSIGYLPEHNPLYPELYIREYLRLIGRIQGVKDLNKRVDEVIDLTGLGKERHKKIQALSKGYRQRVGLAQALMHDPPVLIFDEPTSGLDPNQLSEIRQLIRSLGDEKTVIFSTHIMQEVQAICDRVLIIDQGKMVLDKPIAYLNDLQTGQRMVEVQFDRQILTNSLRKSIPAVTQIEEVDKQGSYKIFSDTKDDIRAQIFRYAVDKGAVILEMVQQKSTVEDVFQHLTKSGDK